ncbi:MAG: hypothetical protein IJK55_09970 [Bacteroidales bacterium]|nr:hypothetical protein [Bacteroidales bacterium]
MKKSLLILCAAALALVSCNKDLAPNETKQGEPVDVVFNLSATHPDGGGTKAVKDAWEAGDVVFVFFSGQTAPAYLELKYDGSKWQNNQKGLSFTTGETGTMTAVYLPFGSDATVSADGGAYKFSKTYYSYYLTGQLEYTVTDGEISGTFAMKIPDGYVQFFVYVPSSYFDLPVELREPHLTPQGIASIAADGTIKTTNVAHGAPLPGYVYKKEGVESDNWGFVFSGILAEEARNVETDYLFTIVYNGWDGMYFKQAFSGKKFYRGEQEGRALRLPDGAWEEITDYKPIDLGINVWAHEWEDGEMKRVYWASRNLGAAKEEDFGDFYAWGETAPKTDYSWATYTFNPSGDGEVFTKYNEEDVYNILEPKDDAAYVATGGRFRIPTIREWEALIDCCDWTFVTQKSGVTGQRISRGERSIFLPAAGWWDGTDHVVSQEVGGETFTGFGYYWTSGRWGPVSEAGLLACRRNHSPELIPIYRHYGHPIRPVCD